MTQVHDERDTGWHILGAGAMGCLWSCYLSQAGFPVELILHYPTRLDRLMEEGEQVHLRSAWQGDGRWTPYPVSASMPDDDGPIHRVVVATKSYDTLDALASVKHRLAGDAVVILLQNGMGVQQQVAEAFPDCALFFMSSTDGAFLQSPFRVVHAGLGQNWIGPAHTETARTHVSSLLAAPLTLDWTDEVHTRLWHKLALNGSINGLTSIYNCRNGELMDIPEARQMVHRLSQETSTLLATLDLDLFEEGLEEEVCNVLTRTARNYSSMNRDLYHGKHTEIEAINGFLIREGQKQGLDMPAHQAVYQQVKKMESLQAFVKA
jgi:2-dehydropantoate 2-reductase